ncbi:hypothetical protein O3P69_003370 [Scylla paramamosain]|uniref:Uncharacterized protein n=1 Tax=Scylla paramamosain TaxID=85552 RepID=A0AAW0UIX4_SCYPA
MFYVTGTPHKRVRRPRNSDRYDERVRSKYKRGADITELVKFICDAADEASDPVFGRLVNKEQKKDKGRNQQKKLCDKLGAKGMTRQMELTTITQTRMPVESTVITLFVSDIHNKQEPCCIPEVTVRPSLNIDLSGLSSCVELQKWPHLQNLEIPKLDVDEVHLLIGQDCADLLLPDEIKKGHPGEPFAIHTPLGWANNGPIDPFKPAVKTSYFVHNRSSLERDLSRLWELEGVNSEAPGMSQSDIKTLETWDARKTIEDNHYTLPIPFKAERPYLADNRNMAGKRLQMLGKRLNKDNNLKERYTEEMHKLLKKGYAVAFPPEDLNRADELMNSIPEKEWGRSFTTLDINRDELQTERALGMLWEIESDCLKVDVQVKNHHKSRREHTIPDQWRYVPTMQNTGDIASRGMTAQELPNEERWCKGPAFLFLDISSWPKQPAFDCAKLEDIAEVKRFPLVYTMKTEEDHLGRFFDYYSTWHRMKKAVAWFLRLRQILRKQPYLKGPLVAEEMRCAEEAIIRHAQKVFLHNETTYLGKLNPKKSASGLLLVGGRLTNSKQEGYTKHQLII